MDLDKKLELLEQHGVDTLDAATVLINFNGMNDETLDYLARELELDFEDFEDDDEDWSVFHHIDSLDRLTIHNVFQEVTRQDGTVRDVSECMATPERGMFGTAMRLLGDRGSVFVELAPIDGRYNMYRMCFEPDVALGEFEEWFIDDADSLEGAVEALYGWARATVGE